MGSVYVSVGDDGPMQDYDTLAEGQAALDALEALGFPGYLEDLRPLVTVEDCRPIQTCRDITNWFYLMGEILREVYAPAIERQIFAAVPVPALRTLDGTNP